MRLDYNTPSLPTKILFDFRNPNPFLDANVIPLFITNTSTRTSNVCVKAEHLVV